MSSGDRFGLGRGAGRGVISDGRGRPRGSYIRSPVIGRYVMYLMFLQTLQIQLFCVIFNYKVKVVKVEKKNRLLIWCYLYQPFTFLNVLNT